MYLYQANSATNGQEDGYERRVNFGTVPGATGGYGQDQVKVSGFHEDGLVVGECFSLALAETTQPYREGG